MSSFRGAFEQLFKLVQRLQAPRLLLELDALPDISAYDQVWLGSHWMPRVTQLPLQRLVITLSARRVYNQQVVEDMLLTTRPLIRFDVQFFSQPIAALRWLTDYAPRLPALLAEWDAAYGPSSSGPDIVAEPTAHYRRS